MKSLLLVFLMISSIAFADNRFQLVMASPNDSKVIFTMLSYVITADLIEETPDYVGVIVSMGFDRIHKSGVVKKGKGHTMSVYWTDPSGTYGAMIPYDTYLYNPKWPTLIDLVHVPSE